MNEQININELSTKQLIALVNLWRTPSVSAANNSFASMLKKCYKSTPWNENAPILYMNNDSKMVVNHAFYNMTELEEEKFLAALDKSMEHVGGEVYGRTDAIGENIKEVMRERGITQKQLAERLEIHPVSLSAMLRGGNMKVETLAKFAAAIGCDVADFFGEPVHRCPHCGKPIAVTLQ
jgi:DNA-binding Xre family transcriptional regulator